MKKLPFIGKTEFKRNPNPITLFVSIVFQSSVMIYRIAVGQSDEMIPFQPGSISIGIALYVFYIIIEIKNRFLYPCSL